MHAAVNLFVRDGASQVPNPQSVFRCMHVQAYIGTYVDDRSLSRKQIPPQCGWISRSNFDTLEKIVAASPRLSAARRAARDMDIEQQSTPKPVLRTNVGPHWSLNSAVSRTPCTHLAIPLAHARAPP